MYAEKIIRTDFGGCHPVTEEIQKVIENSGVLEGYCVVSLDGLSAALGITSFWDSRGLDDLMDELAGNIPARVDYHNQTSPFNAAGQVKGAVVGGSILLVIQNGRMVLGSSQGLVLLEFDGPRERVCRIQVIEAHVRLTRHQVKTRYMGMHDITETVKKSVADSAVETGICHISQLHSTAGLMLCSAKEGDCVTVMEDLERLVPTRADFKHRETASDAGGHVKTAITGSQLSLAIDRGAPVLSDNQAVVFAEYDGPRPRTYCISIIQR